MAARPRQSSLTLQAVAAVSSHGTKTAASSSQICIIDTSVVITLLTTQALLITTHWRANLFSITLIQSNNFLGFN